MTALLFAYPEARRIALEVELERRRVDDHWISIKGIPCQERLGGTLITRSEGLVPASPDRNPRYAA